MAKMRKKRRRVRWGRLILTACVVSMAVWTAGYCCWQIYSFASEMYGKYESFKDSLQTKPTLTGQLADKRFEGYTNILLAGLDDGNAEEGDSAKNADTVMIASIKKADGSVRILSVPGETIANIPGRQNIDNINKAYFYGEMQLTIRTIEEMLYFPIHHYAIIEMSAFSDFVDLIDGVNLYVEEDMDYEDAYSGFAIHLKKGYQHLDGAAAEQYVRYRGDELGSISRVQRQQKFIKAMNERLAEMDAVAKLPQFADFIKEKIVISLSPLDAVKLMADLYGLNAQKITIEMLPGEFVSINGRQHWQILEKDKQELLDRLFPIVQAGE